MTAQGAVNFTYLDMQNTTTDINHGFYRKENVIYGDGLQIKVNNQKNKDVNLTGFRFADNNGMSNGKRSVEFKGNNGLVFRTEVSNPTVNSTNYSIHATNSEIILKSSAHFYSSEIKGTNNSQLKDKYGIYLENSRIWFTPESNKNSLHISNLVNNNSEIIVNNFLIPAVNKNKQQNTIDFKYSKEANSNAQGLPNSKYYFGTIHNTDPNKKLKFNYMEYSELGAMQHGSWDEGFKSELPLDCEEMRVIYNFLTQNPSPSPDDPDNKHRFHVGNYRAITNLKLENGKQLFDYIDIVNSVADGANSVKNYSYFLTSDKLYVLHKKFTQSSTIEKEGEPNQQTDVTVGHLDVSTDIEVSEDGKDGANGTNGNSIHHSSLVSTKNTSASLDSIKTTSFIGGNGTAGTDGTDAHLFGHGGDGGRGGSGGSIDIALVASSKIATISGTTSITAQGGDGAKGANGGKKKTHDKHLDKYNKTRLDGYKGVGGSGGSVNLVGYRAVGEGPGGAGIGVRDAIITLDNVDMTLIGKASKGAESGKFGRDTVAGTNDKLPSKGEDGKVRVSGVDVLSGATLHVKDSAKIHTEAHVHNKKDGKAYSLYMKGDGSPFNEKHNASVLEVGGNLDLSSSINVNGKVEKGNGIHLENTVIAFKDDNGGKGQFGSNKTKYYTITTDRVELSGDNAIVFYTDIQSGKGDKVVVTDGFDILKKGKLKIRIHSDASIKDPTEFTGTLNVSGKHTLIDLPDNIGKLPDDVLGRIDSAWKEDNGAVKLSIKADISQDNNFDIVVNNIASSNTNQASNPVETAMINTFLINRMAFLTNSELSERFRMLKKDNSRNYGLWVQNFYKDVDFDVNDKIGLTAHAKLNSSYIGFDTLKSFGEYDAMYGAYAGYSKMKSTLNLFEASSDIKNTNVGIYGALAFNTGTYFEGSVHYNHFDSTAKSRIEGGYQGEDSGTLKINSIGTTLAAGHRFNLAYDTVIDAALKFDYKLFMGENFTTKKGLEIIGDTYSTYGLATSVLVGKYLNDRHSLVYVKGEAGYHYSDISSKTSVKDRAKIFSFDNPDYDFTYGSMALGVNHRFFNCVDATLEAHNYFLEGSKSDNFGIKAELRYVF